MSKPKREEAMFLTDDIFLGAYGLVRGGKLAYVEVEMINGRRVAVFSIEGSVMEKVEEDYYGGKSSVDLRLFKSEVIRLKNIAFAALRKEERRDAGEQGRHREDQGCESSARRHY